MNKDTNYESLCRGLDYPDPKSAKMSSKEDVVVIDDDDLSHPGPLLEAQWYRIILDEAHVIKNKYARCSKAAAQLKSKYRWCLSGTPIQNNVNELFPLIRFLNIRPYNDWSRFKKISDSINHGSGKTGLLRVQAIMKGKFVFN